MFKFEDNKRYPGMPSHFGGYDYDPAQENYYHDTVSMSCSYTTDGDLLANYIPEGFELLRPELSVSYVSAEKSTGWQVPPTT